MIDTITKQEYFNFLDILRESGVTNMFGAPSYLVDEYGISKKEAFSVFKEWAENFNRGGTQ